MLERTKKVLTRVLIKLRIIEKIEDKSEKHLTTFQIFIVFFITYCLKEIVGIILNLDFYHHAFFSLMTLFEVILYMIIGLPVYNIVYRVNKLINHMRKGM